MRLDRDVKRDCLGVVAPRTTALGYVARGGYGTVVGVDGDLGAASP